MKPFNNVNLKTERLLIRPLVESDANSLFSIYSDPDAMKFWNTAPWADFGKAKELIQKDIEALRKGFHLRLGIESKNEGELIGTCSLFSFNEQCKRAEIGYILSKSFWGKGFMKEALTALIDYAFKTLSLHRIEADIDPQNISSANILNRLGFSKEGRLRERWIVNGEILDSDLFGLLRHEWCKK
jgi:RimJ/RimL family protein N-acetyltransferase